LEVLEQAVQIDKLDSLEEFEQQELTDKWNCYMNLPKQKFL
jgi:hypothetical protein